MSACCYTRPDENRSHEPTTGVPTVCPMPRHLWVIARNFPYPEITPARLLNGVDTWGYTPRMRCGDTKGNAIGPRDWNARQLGGLRLGEGGHSRQPGA